MPHLPDHVTHDPELIAAYAAGDAAGPALDQAADLVASCTECAELHRDLRAISTALPELPAPVRPRDFRLTPEQAASLRPAGWRGVLAAFAAPRFRLAAPLGTGLAAAGLAGLLLASPGGLLPRATGEAASGSAPSAAGAPAVQADQASGAAARGPPRGAQPVDGAATDPERAYLRRRRGQGLRGRVRRLARCRSPAPMRPTRPRRPHRRCPTPSRDAGPPRRPARPPAGRRTWPRRRPGIGTRGRARARRCAQRAGAGRPDRPGTGGGRRAGDREPGHPGAGEPSCSSSAWRSSCSALLARPRSA